MRAAYDLVMMYLAAIATLLTALDASSSPAPQSPPSCSAAVGYIGTSCTPSTPGKHPAILLLGGSEGGDSLAPEATVYARAGFVATSVAYFGTGDLPKTLQLIPVETIGIALSALEKRDDVDPARIAILGISKGGELALLAASTYPSIHAVVADVPSPFAWEGIPAGPSSEHVSSWTVNGRPLPFIPYSTALGIAFGTAYATRAPLDLRPAYDASVTENRAAIAGAMFPLEKIDGPVLFLSAGDDRIWNSADQAQMGLAYLRNKHHAFADESHTYPGAGHLFLLSSPDRPFVDVPFAGGLTLLLGGSPSANEAAGNDATARIAVFLRNALAAR